MVNLTMLVLDLATDDFFGLWELVWRVNAVTKSGSDVVTHEQLRAEVLRLCTDGFVAVYRGRRFDGDESVLGIAEAKAILDDRANWESAVAAAEHFRVAATFNAEAEYRRSYRELPM
jgi:hypothetical protein